MLDPGAHTGLRAVDQSLERFDDDALAHQLIGQVLGRWRRRRDQHPLAGIGAVTPGLPRLAMDFLFVGAINWRRMASDRRKRQDLVFCMDWHAEKCIEDQ